MCLYLVKRGHIYSCSEIRKSPKLLLYLFKQTYILCEVTELTYDDAFPEGMKYWQISLRKIKLYTSQLVPLQPLGRRNAKCWHFLHILIKESVLFPPLLACMVSSQRVPSEFLHPIWWDHPTIGTTCAVIPQWLLFISRVWEPTCSQRTVSHLVLIKKVMGDKARVNMALEMWFRCWISPVCNGLVTYFILLCW